MSHDSEPSRPVSCGVATVASLLAARGPALARESSIGIPTCHRAQLRSWSPSRITGSLALLCVTLLGGIKPAIGQVLIFERTDFPNGPNAFDMATGDFDGDLDVDLAVANFGSPGGESVWVFLHNGDGDPIHPGNVPI